MKTTVGALSLALLLAATSAAAAPANELMAPVHQFMDSFNKGDAKNAEAAHATAVAIIDEVPPHSWAGAGAFQAWLADLDRSSKANGQTDEAVTLGKPTRAEVNGDSGYVIVPATFTYLQHGKRMAEQAQMAFALHKEAAGWKIAAWAWTGGIPHTVTAKPKPKPKPTPEPKAP
jgi:hypothetical protein